MAIESPTEAAATMRFASPKGLSHEKVQEQYAIIEELGRFADALLRLGTPGANGDEPDEERMEQASALSILVLRWKQFLPKTPRYVTERSGAQMIAKRLQAASNHILELLTQ